MTEVFASGFLFGTAFGFALADILGSDIDGYASLAEDFDL